MRTPNFSGIINLKYDNPSKGFSTNFSGHLTGNMYIENYVQKKIDKTPFYLIWNWNISKIFHLHWILNIGVDNIFNYVQKVRFTPDIDSAYIYAPLVGRYFYVALRYKL